MRHQFASRFVSAGLVLGLGLCSSIASAVPQESIWTGLGDGISYSDPNNWTPVMALPPVNVGPVTFNITIPYISAHPTARYDQVLGNAQINNLSLADNATLRLQDTVNLGAGANVTKLTANGTATINGIISADNADFTVVGTTTLGNRARFSAANSAIVTLPATTYAATGLSDTYTLMSADGAGAQLNLSALSSIDDGFATFSYYSVPANTHTIVARNSGQINLSGVQTILGPTGAGSDNDSLNITAESGGSINLNGLKTLDGRGGTVNVSVTGAASNISLNQVESINKATFTPGTGLNILLPATKTISNSTFTATSNSSIQATGSPTSYWATDLGGNYTLMSADGAGAQLNLSALSSIDDGFATFSYYSVPANTHTIVARNSGQINLSGVQTILGPTGAGSDNDSLNITAESGGSINLNGLKTLDGRGGTVNVSVTDAGSSINLTHVESLNKTNLAVSGAGSVLSLPMLKTFNGGTGAQHITVNNGGLMVLGQLTNTTPLGSIAFTGTASTLSMRGGLNLAANTALTVEQGATINLASNLGFAHTNEANVQLADATVRMGGKGIQTLEAGGLDVGTATMFLANDNFGIGQLIVDQSGPARGVQLTDDADNGNRNGFGGASESLYLFGLNGENGLRILHGSTLAMGNYHVYAKVGADLMDLSTLFSGAGQKVAFDGGYIQNVLFGDYNGDGRVTLSDIDPFKLALTDETAFQGAYPQVNLELVDPNGDGSVTLSDINPFKSLLAGNGELATDVVGDYNGDGSVTLSDVNPFKQALTDENAFRQNFPQVNLMLADPNYDGVLTLSDISPFMALLAGGGAGTAETAGGNSVPEPTSLTLWLAMGGWWILSRSRARTRS